MTETTINKYKQLKEQRIEFCKKNGVESTKLLKIAKELVTKGRTNSSLNLNKMNRWSKEQYLLAVAALNYIYSEVYGLSPEQVDALWQDNKINERDFLDATSTRNIVDKIISETNPTILKDCLFNTKKIILRTLYPEYYKVTYNMKYNILTDIVNADDIVIRDLRAAGKSKNKSNNNKTNSNGRIIDELIMEGLECVLNTRDNIIDYKTKLQILSDPKRNKYNILGLNKVFKSRGCYESLLDFYYLNSSKAKQQEYFSEYVRLRKMNIKKSDTITNLLSEISKIKDEYDLQ